MYRQCERLNKQFEDAMCEAVGAWLAEHIVCYGVDDAIFMWCSI